MSTLPPRLPWFRAAVSGPSMLPALAPGDWLLVRRNVPARVGDVVVVRRPQRLVVKRLTRVESDGRLWVEGDNAAASDDSRTFGPVDPADVAGVARWRYFPLPAIGRIPSVS